MCSVLRCLTTGLRPPIFVAIKLKADELDHAGLARSLQRLRTDRIARELVSIHGGRSIGLGKSAWKSALSLLRASDNSDLQSGGFGTKRKIYKASPYILTSQIGELADWDAKAIAARRLRLRPSLSGGLTSSTSPLAIPTMSFASWAGSRGRGSRRSTTADSAPSVLILEDPDIGCRLGRKGDHHRRISSCYDNLDSEAFSAAIQRDDPIRRISVKVCIDHAANMACRMPICNPASRGDGFPD
jgi:hypothetical protein